MGFDFGYHIKSIAVGTLIYATIFGLTMLGLRACNAEANTGSINHPGHQTISYPINTTGHVDYTRFSDGSQEIYIHPNKGILGYAFKLIQDTNGDCLADRIRKQNPLWKLDSLQEILIRDQDLGLHQEDFDEADELLQELGQEYFGVCY